MYPDEHTIQEIFIEVGEGHQLYGHEWGNKKAKTTFLFLHGGPGSGCSDGHKRRFNPKQHHVVFFDQRGSGRSLPYGSLKDNTTGHLVKDVSVILDHFKLKKVVLTGGSWGSTLALAYAVAHPKRVQAMVLQGIFAGSKSEIDWLDKGLFKTFYPDAWEQYLGQTPKSHWHNPTAYHRGRILGTDEQAMSTSGLAYEALEGSVMNLDDRPHSRNSLDYDPLPIRLEIQYLKNNCFMPDNHILDNAAKLTMPVWLVQGRYDMVCPPITAHALHKKLPNSHLLWTIAGHRSADRSSDDVLRALLLQFS